MAIYDLLPKFTKQWNHFVQLAYSCTIIANRARLYCLYYFSKVNSIIGSTLGYVYLIGSCFWLPVFGSGFTRLKAMVVYASQSRTALLRHLVSAVCLTVWVYKHPAG